MSLIGVTTVGGAVLQPDETKAQEMSDNRCVHCGVDAEYHGAVCLPVNILQMRLLNHTSDAHTATSGVSLK